jgi:tRNA U54 and U55 pseudouridine synthase Pus10
MLGVGKPLVVTVKEPAVPTVNVVLFALVIDRDWLTVNVNVCVAGEPAVFEAVKLML